MKSTVTVFRLKLLGATKQTYFCQFVCLTELMLVCCLTGSLYTIFSPKRNKYFIFASANWLYKPLQFRKPHAAINCSVLFISTLTSSSICNIGFQLTLLHVVI